MVEVLFANLCRRIVCVISLLILFGVFFQPHPVAAQPSENYVIDYNVIYAIKDDGTAHSSVTVTLTNATSDYYISLYKIQLGFENLVNVQASDSNGPITPKLTKTDAGQVIEVKFNKNVVGLGNKQVLKINFDTPDITQKQGKIWEINIPRIADQDQFNSFDVELQVPNSFGPPVYVKPCTPHPSLFPQRERENAGCRGGGLKFSKEQLGKSGISVAFGDKQYYSFDLLYHVKNANLFPIRTEIALPPTTNYQEVYIDSIEPEPLQVREDEDGNWLAEYTLRSSERVDIRVKGRAALSLEPKKEFVSEQELQKYLKEQPYWQLSNEKIRTAAKDLKTPEDIYNYVVKTLSYDYTRVTGDKIRLGAENVIQNPTTAVCLEFTDLFVALARAAGIPAREVDGFAYTENPKQRPLSLVQDILHAWPEYYDREQRAWIMVDPTWGDTTGGVDYFHTLDFDHLAFSKKGISSTYPITAGGYKIDGEEKNKDVHITFIDDFVYQPAKVALQAVVAESVPGGLPVGGSIVAINKGPGVSAVQKIFLQSKTLTPNQQYKQIEQLLPFQKQTIPFQFDKKPLLTKSTHVITMGLTDCSPSPQPSPLEGEGEFVPSPLRGEGKDEGGCVIAAGVTIVPFYIQQWKLLGGVGIAILTIIISVIAIKTRRIRLS